MCFAGQRSRRVFPSRAKLDIHFWAFTPDEVHNPKIVFYPCVSTRNQDPSLQIDAARQTSIPSEYIFVEKASGVSNDRPVPAQALPALESGDTLGLLKSRSRRPLSSARTPPTSARTARLTRSSMLIWRSVETLDGARALAGYVESHAEHQNDDPKGQGGLPPCFEKREESRHLQIQRRCRETRAASSVLQEKEGLTLASIAPIRIEYA